VNKQVEYEEYKAIMTAGFLFEAKNPYFRWKNRFSSDVDMDTGNENLTPEFFVTSDVSLTAQFTQCSSLKAR
jgi:hypothetical protein